MRLKQTIKKTGIKLLQNLLPATLIISIFLLSSFALVKAATLLKTIPVGGGAGPGIVVTDSNRHRAYATSVPAIVSDSFLAVIDTVNDTLLTNIPLGAQPGGLGINRITNRVYVSNHFVHTVSVIDPETNSIIETISGSFDRPREIAVNESNNLVYVTNIRNVISPGYVTVIDGNTNSVIDNITVGRDPRSVAVNSLTNRIYVSAAGNDPGLTVIDGSNNSVLVTLSFPIASASGVAVDEVFNRIYVTVPFINRVFVIDGVTNTVTSIIPMHPTHTIHPVAVAVDSASLRAYVSNSGDAPNGSLISVIDTSTNTLLEHVVVGTNALPSTLDIDLSLNKLYVPLFNAGSVAVINVNQPPQVDAGRDQIVVVNNLASLDGSGSFDPDSDSLTYSWSEDPANPEVNLLSDPTAVNPTFTPTSVGLYRFTLVVNDGALGSEPDTIDITVQTPSQAIQDLVDQVESFNLQQGIDNSLDAKLDRAQDALTDVNQNNDIAAINSLEALINSVEAQRGNALTNEQADELIQMAQEVIDSLSV